MDENLQPESIRIHFDSDGKGTSNVSDEDINRFGGIKKDDKPKQAESKEEKGDDGEHSHHSHHHSHRSHHHGYRSRRRSSNKKVKKFVSFLKQHRSVLINILSCTLSALLLILVAFNVDLFKPKSDDEVLSEVTQSTIKIETSIFPEKISLVSDAISYYMNPNNTSDALKVYKSFDGYKGGLNFGKAVNFTYRVVGLPTGVRTELAQLIISENQDLKEPLTYNLDLDDTSIDIYNLKTNAQYYYQVNFTLDNGSTIGANGSFATEKSPRIMNIDGAVNVRDIGGWTTDSGKTISQGLLYRGSEIDGAFEKNYKLSDLGLQQMLGELGIRYDLDLRSEDENKERGDALGKNVKHEYYSIGQYADVFEGPNKQIIRKIFATLSNKDNYPIYIHCTYGRDRTGTVSYLLGAILGMSDDDLYRDYELSAFTDSYVNTKDFNYFLAKISTFSGNTTKQRVENYLMSIGVTEKEISNIRAIFLGQ